MEQVREIKGSMQHDNRLDREETITRSNLLAAGSNFRQFMGETCGNVKFEFNFMLAYSQLEQVGELKGSI